MNSTLTSTFYRDNFLYRGSLGRKQYWISYGFAMAVSLVMLASIYLPTVLMISLDVFADVESFETANWVVSLLAGSIVLYVAVCMMFAGARRLRDAGIKPWLAFIFVPAQAMPTVGIGFFIAMVVLCALPSKINTQSA